VFIGRLFLLTDPAGVASCRAQSCESWFSRNKNDQRKQLIGRGLDATCQARTARPSLKSQASQRVSRSRHACLRPCSVDVCTDTRTDINCYRSMNLGCRSVRRRMAPSLASRRKLSSVSGTRSVLNKRDLARHFRISSLRILLPQRAGTCRTSKMDTLTANRMARPDRSSAPSVQDRY
jgi:hypothetical protein